MIETIHKKALFGASLTELKLIVGAYGLPTFAAKQIADWIYKKNCFSIDEMTNLSLVGRNRLKEDFEVGKCRPLAEVQTSVDGTRKYLFPIGENQYVESVYIPDKDRATLCVSSQVGCKMNCRFCATGKQGFSQNLSAGEIVNQICALPEFEQLTNIVYMGMGEPLDNIDEVLKSLEILTTDWGFAMSPRRITVSSIGLTSELSRLLNESQCHVAISLHNPFSEERLQLMPMEKPFPITETIDLLKQYSWQGQRRVSFEYILFAGINDTHRHLSELAYLLSDLTCRVNLIGYHSLPETDLRGSDKATMMRFRDELTKKGITTTIRASRGEDILAACGLLSSKTNKHKSK